MKKKETKLITAAPEQKKKIAIQVHEHVLITFF